MVGHVNKGRAGAGVDYKSQQEVRPDEGRQDRIEEAAVLAPRGDVRCRAAVGGLRARVQQQRQRRGRRPREWQEEVAAGRGAPQALRLARAALARHDGEDVGAAARGAGGRRERGARVPLCARERRERERERERESEKVRERGRWRGA